MSRDLRPEPRSAATAAPAAPLDPRDVVAVVVGIDRYGGSPRWDLAGPVRDAVRFVRWFRSIGVPAERITLLASPAGSGVPKVPEVPAGVEVLPADRATVREVLVRRLAPVEHRTLFVVWGGHGFVDVARRRRLYYADTDADDPLDLDLDSLLARFASSRVPHLDRQFWIVDACQVEASTPQRPNHETFEAGDAVPGRAQDVLFAAGFGEQAVDLGVERTGVFSREVLRILEAGGPAALGTLAERLRDVFADLRARGKTAQTPTYLWYRSATGDEGHVLRDARPAPPPAAGREPGLHELAPVVDALVAVPEFQRPYDREAILGLLRGGVYTVIPRHQAARLDAVSVLRTCLRFPGGLAELVEAVRFFAAGTAELARFEAAAGRLRVEP